MAVLFLSLILEILEILGILTKFNKFLICCDVTTWQNPKSCYYHYCSLVSKGNAQESYRRIFKQSNLLGNGD